MDPGSSGASFVRGVGFIVAGIVALAMMLSGGFGWLGFFVPLVILIASGSLSDQIKMADRSRKARVIQLELARASIGPTERARRSGGAIAMEAHAATAGAVAERPRLLGTADPRTRAEVIAVLDRLVADVRGLRSGDRLADPASHPRQRRSSPSPRRTSHST